MKQGRLGAWVAATFGAWWCSRYTWPLLNPFSLDVVFQRDWAQHTLGWLFFRHESLAFPLGKLPGFLHPLGTTVGYMDAIPWVALSLRPWSALLPTDFQYLGLWILLCSAGLGFVGARIASGVTPHWEQQALAGALMAMAPILIARIIHPALCAHVLVVAALGLNLLRTDTAVAARRAVLWALGLVFVGSATHPYFAVMPLALLIGLPVRLRSQLGPTGMCVAMGAMVGVAAGVLTLLGYLGGGMQDAVSGFGTYSANLNTLFNSMGHSRIFPGLPAAHNQDEGYGYLGAGSFFLGAAALTTLLWPRTRQRVLDMPWRRGLWPLMAACACAVFAFASPVRWGRRELFHIEAYACIAEITQTFRSSGRFIWPLAYSLELAAILIVVRALRPHRAWLTFMLLLAAVLQAYDLRLDEALGRFNGAHHQPFAASQWSLADGEFKHLVMYPAQVRNACRGRKPYETRLVSELAYLAYRHHWTFNSGYAARYPPAQQQTCEDLNQRVMDGELRGDELYVVDARELRRMRRAGATCGQLDQLSVCVQSSASPLATYLALQPP